MGVEIEILRLASERTGQTFAIATFAADTDMATDGWISLTSLERDEIVITRMTAEEWQATAQDLSAMRLVEQRVNALLGRQDLRCSWLVRVEERSASGRGMSFEEFRKVHRSPVLCYRDVFSPDGVAKVVGRSSIARFEAAGGTVTHVE